MCERYKGVLVTFDKEVRSEKIEKYISFFKMIKNVHSVKVYEKDVKDCEMKDFYTDELRAVIEDLPK